MTSPLVVATAQQELLRQLLTVAMFAAYLILLLLLAWWATRSAARHDVERLAAALGPSDVSADGWSLVGHRDGRRVRVALERDVTYAVELPAGSAELFMEDARSVRAWVRAAGAQGAEALAAVEVLALCGARRIEAKGRWLTAHRARSLRALREPSALRILDALARLAPLLGRAPLQVKVAGVHGAVAWAEGERLLCPYCRVDLAAERLEVVCCPACRTAHHAECFGDAGGCTVLGCRGAPAPWTRVRGG